MEAKAGLRRSLLSGSIRCQVNVVDRSKQFTVFWLCTVNIVCRTGDRKQIAGGGEKHEF